MGGWAGSMAIRGVTHGPWGQSKSWLEYILMKSF